MHLTSNFHIDVLIGHSSFVNSIHPARRGPPLLCSASDDCNIKIWDPRKRTETVSLDNTYQVTAVTFNDTAEQVISAGIDNDVKVRSFRNTLENKRGLQGWYDNTIIKTCQITSYYIVLTF